MQKSIEEDVNAEHLLNSIVMKTVYRLSNPHMTKLEKYVILPILLAGAISAIMLLVLVLINGGNL